VRNRVADDLGLDLFERAHVPSVLSNASASRGAAASVAGADGWPPAKGANGEISS
jgi:hypothetical protein